MGACAGIILAGGRSSRMGSDKASLEWHGSTLLRRVTGIVARGVDGPLVVVRASGQSLPELDPTVEIVEDARPRRGPLQGLAAGLAAVGGRAKTAYVSAADVPLLHPAFVRHVVSALKPGVDVALPVVDGRPQPLAGAYRVSLVPLLQELLDADHLRPACLFERCRVRPLTEQALRDDPRLAELDPQLRSLENLNEPADLRRALALDPPAIELDRPAPPHGRHTLRAYTLAAAAAAAGLNLQAQVAVILNGRPISGDPQYPLVSGDRLVLRAAGEPMAGPVSVPVPGG